ncbi:MAG: hypothetical protein QNK03_28185 [Myxococcota bacterium]|nr:hypothetical protein [Myxococcota bacterium]
MLEPAEARSTEDDEFITRALESASVPTLMRSRVHVTGDASLLHGPIRPQPAIPGEVQASLSEADEAAGRARALEVLAAPRDRGCSLPPPGGHRRPLLRPRRAVVSP